ncbi:hypothetical protein SAMN05428969_1341 [Devosia sp. YR412]|uniref:hypothetical protein n=1 Tax=Devosia sp. YR412 TaxID=1881030 RepID=UPI0008C5A000|nr:hypothetical protein [Devosia sp. YR412]SEP96995.1 hypothetical protein SAMN05428969_1341 [Devosia sp. YR412]
MIFRPTLFAIAAPLLCLSSFAAAQEPAAPAYDPAPFLSSMVALRTAAVTCEPFVAASPATRTAAIPAFFKTLNQDLPDLVDGETQKSLNIFVGAQAAQLCRDKLDAAYAAYGAQSAIYLNSKPADWPDPPEISNAPWCSSEYCLEF